MRQNKTVEWIFLFYIKKMSIFTFLLPVCAKEAGAAVSKRMIRGMKQMSAAQQKARFFPNGVRVTRAGGKLATLSGLEPELSGPKPLVLPLHHRVAKTNRFLL